MEWSEVHARLLSIARERLKLRAGAYDRFRLAFPLHGMHSPYVMSSVVHGDPYGAWKADHEGDYCRVDEKLLDIIDRWADEHAPAQPIAPLGSFRAVGTTDHGRRALLPQILTDATVGGDAGCTESPPPAQAAQKKRKALVEQHIGAWPSIERDLKDASANGLREAAGGDRLGWWREAEALDWARARGKLQDRAATPSTVFNMGRRTG